MKSKIEQRPIDQIFDEYNQVAATVKYPALLYIAVILMMFGLLAFIWALPFPHLAFLGKYNGFVNWASFLIAALIYYYLRLSPVISYLMLFLLFGFSYGIIQLEGWQKSGGWPLWSVGLGILAIGVLLQVLLLSTASFVKRFKILLKSPIWLLVSIIKLVKLKY